MGIEVGLFLFHGLDAMVTHARKRRTDSYSTCDDKEYNVAASERKIAMNNNYALMMFEVIFIIVTVLICAGVVMIALNRIGSAATLRRRKRGSYRPATAHRAYKDVI
jgi:hypothetical protein